jgi:hypothetical protein
MSHKINAMMISWFKIISLFKKKPVVVERKDLNEVVHIWR